MFSSRSQFCKRAFVEDTETARLRDSEWMQRYNSACETTARPFGTGKRARMPRHRIIPGKLCEPSMSASVLATPPDDVNGIAELWTMAAIVFLVFYSNYMVAPLIPALARAFGVHSHDLKWLIPGFSMMYGAATLPYGILSDRFGRYPVLRILLGFAAVTTMSLSFAWAMGPDRDRLKIQSL